MRSMQDCPLRGLRALCIGEKTAQAARQAGMQVSVSKDVYKRQIEQSDVIAGYTVYVDLIRQRFADKTFLTTPMKQEVDRCRMAIEMCIRDRVNFQRQNEVIVEDEQKQQWNLSIEDSNHLRAMLTGLG